MEFTYSAYRKLLWLLREKDYAFAGYQDYEDSPRCVILRHDIDFSLDQAVCFAELEAKQDVRSTWFVLLRTDFYNAASKAGQEALQFIRSLGHEIGLHFDEASYVLPLGRDEMVQSILKECGLLSALLETRVSAVSMHRPSQGTLEADYQIPDVVNSYSRTFFHEFKYLSDSRRRWREPVEDIVRSGMFDRLHILTHAFWYHEEEESLEETVKAFIHAAGQERYCQMRENITDMDTILPESEAFK